MMMASMQDGRFDARDGSNLTTPVHLTPTQLADHLACAHLTQLERQRREGLLQVAFSPTPVSTRCANAAGSTNTLTSRRCGERAARSATCATSAIVVASPQLFEPDCRTRSRWGEWVLSIRGDGDKGFGTRVPRCRRSLCSFPGSGGPYGCVSRLP